MLRLTALLLCSAAAQQVPLAPTPRNGTVGGAAPVQVHLSFTPVQVAKVDVTVQNNYIDVYVTLSWQDGGLAECSSGGSGSPAQAPATWTAWAPSPVFINHVDDGQGSLAFTQAYCGAPAGVDAALGSEGWVNFYGRITGTFVSRMQMRDFPQDVQSVTLSLESDTFDQGELVWQLLPTIPT